MRRADDRVEVGCPTTGAKWTMNCVDGQWNGDQMTGAKCPGVPGVVIPGPGSSILEKPEAGQAVGSEQANNKSFISSIPDSKYIHKLNSDNIAQTLTGIIMLLLNIHGTDRQSPLLIRPAFIVYEINTRVAYIVNKMLLFLSFLLVHCLMYYELPSGVTTIASYLTPACQRYIRIVSPLTTFDRETINYALSIVGHP